jgi:hypothetical protein
MSEASKEGFFRRWSRLKTSGAPEPEPQPAVPVAVAPAGTEAAEAPQRPAPTLEDAARLTQDSDFSAFMARDVDQAVRRLALKKLLADPHFKLIDGLDMYMDDYNKAAPVTPEMLSQLRHAQQVVAGLLGEQEQEQDTEAAQQTPPPPQQGSP